MNLEAVFHQFHGEYLEFDRVIVKRSRREDLHAFMLLDSLLPGSPGDRLGSLIQAAEHEVIWLSIDLEALALVITEEQVCELVRCGVRYDKTHNCLSLFV